MRNMIVSIVLVSLAATAPALAGDPAEQSITLWGVIFNSPENCSDGLCDEDDVLVDPGPPETAVVYLGGTRVQANGRFSVGAAFEAGQTFGALPFPTVTLYDVDEAEVHLIVRTHGSYVPGIADEQITTFGQGCMDECRDLQFAIFKPADADDRGRQSATVHRFADLGAIAGGWATLFRDEGGVRAAIHSRLGSGRPRP